MKERKDDAPPFVGFRDIVVPKRAAQLAMACEYAAAIKRRRARRIDQAATALVRSVLPLIYKFSRRYVRHGVELNELMQAGAIAAADSLRRYDPTKGCTFFTFAYYEIRWAILKTARTSRRLIQMSADTIRRAAKAKRLVATGRTVSKKQLTLIRHYENSKTCALDVPIRSHRARDPSEGLTRHERIHAPVLGPEAEAMDHELVRLHQQSLQRAFSVLDPNEALVIRRLYSVKPKTLTEIEAELGKLRGYARRTHERALEKLRKHLGKPGRELIPDPV